MEHGTLSRRRARVAAVLVLAGVIAGVAGAVRVLSPKAGFPADPVGEVPGATTRAPDSVRIRVEVLNATRTRGLARRATRWLRDGGFDVVYTGTSRETHDSTLVLDRSGHPHWAALVAERLGGARVLSRPDSSRYLDVTVLIGALWSPPSEPLYP